jgi:hypothetical protein
MISAAVLIGVGIVLHLNAIPLSVVGAFTTPAVGALLLYATDRSNERKKAEFRSRGNIINDLERGSLPADEDIGNLNEEYSRMFLQRNRLSLADYGYATAKYVQDNWERLHEK